MPFKLTNGLGVRGEEYAQKYLHNLGYLIVATNFCNYSGRRLGEIDIIAKDGNEFVFIEVKTRKFNKAFTVLPEESITKDKLYKLSKIAGYYIKQKNLWGTPYRFDAVTVCYFEKSSSCEIKHLKNIFI